MSANTQDQNVPIPNAEPTMPAATGPANSAGKAQAVHVGSHVVAPNPSAGPSIPGGGQAKGQQAGGGQARQQARPQTPFTTGFSGAQPRNQQYQQQQINPKLVLDFTKLLQSNSGDSGMFKMTEIGMLLNSIGNQYGQEVTEVEWSQSLMTWKARLGQCVVYFVTGLKNRDTPVFKIVERDMPLNPWTYYAYGNPLTQLVLPTVWNDQGDVCILIYEDDFEMCRRALAYHIGKCAFPSLIGEGYISEDKYLGPTSGFRIIDTRIETHFKEELLRFVQENRLTAMAIPATEVVAMTVSQQQGYAGSFQYGGQNPFGAPPFGAPPTGFGNANPYGVGQNGGFNINQSFTALPSTIVLAAVKYHVRDEEVPGYTGQKFHIVHITEIIENRHFVVEGFLKHFIMHFAQQGYQISLDLDLSKLSQHLVEQIKMFFYANPQDPKRFHNQMAYIHPDMKTFNRIHNDYLTPKTFSALFPDLAKVDKFPKALQSQEDKERFEEFKRRAGYIPVLSVGDQHLQLNPACVQSLYTELQQRRWAVYHGKTLEEAIQEYEESLQNPQNNPNAGQAQGQQRQQGYQNPGFNNPMFAQQPQSMGFGMGPNYGYQQGYGQPPFPGQPPMGGFAAPPGYGGYPQQQPFGQPPFGQQPMYGQMGYGVPPYGQPYQAQPDPNMKGKGKGAPQQQQFQQPYYYQQGYGQPYPQQPPGYYGPPQGMQPPGYNYYGGPQPQGLAGGAFPYQPSPQQPGGKVFVN